MSTEHEAASTGSGRGKRRVVTGTVVSDKMDKTITVRQERLVKHPLYGKYIRRATRYKAHDEANLAKMGDTVEITFCRPMSKTKTWRLVNVVKSVQGGAQ
jgi:small subunit ribosomal protein S17